MNYVKVEENTIKVNKETLSEDGISAHSSVLKRSIVSQRPVKLEKEETEPKEDDSENKGKLMEKENRDTGAVSAKYYLYYLSAAGALLSILTFTFFGLSIFFKMAIDFWIGAWMENKYPKLSDKDYIDVTLILSLVTFSFLCLRAIFLGYVTQLASVNIFKLIVWNIMRRPMSFFDTTPSGVIINRCTSDVDQLDFNIPWMMSFFLNTGFNFAGAMILTAIGSPLVLIFIVIALIILSRSFGKYMRTTTELKRLV